MGPSWILFINPTKDKSTMSLSPVVSPPSIKPLIALVSVLNLNVSLLVLLPVKFSIPEKLVRIAATADAAIVPVPAPVISQ